jgi:adenylate kinase family enzyme
MQAFANATRIHIVGGAGSGKTTLANQLSACLALPCYDLDAVAYVGGYAAKIPLADRVATLEQIVAQPKWVVEGVYIWWTVASMDAADVVVWLDMPFYINGWRIVARHFRLSWAGTNRHPGFIKLLRFLTHVMQKQIRDVPIPAKGTDDDAAITRAATREFLAPYASKVVHCQSPADVAAFKKQICSQSGSQTER